MTGSSTPAWWQRGAIYQIYPRSFADSNGDGVGDLRGVIDRLDYLNDGTPRSLGVEAIWLSPFYRSPMVDFGYDVSEHTEVDPVFGTLADFDLLLAEAHKRGIRVIVDWVPNHTSNRHSWFRESCAPGCSPKRRWYVWCEPGAGGRPPNNWHSQRQASGPAWTFDPGTGEYYLHSFMPQQPDLNWDNPEVEAAMHETLRFWLDRGVDGFRVDAVSKIAKDPLLRDNTFRRHDEDWPTIHDRLRRLRRVVDEYDERILVGEVYLMDLGRVVRYVDTGDQLHLAHNFQFVHQPWDADCFDQAIVDFEALSTGRAWPAWFLGNHDHSRIASRYGRDGLGEQRARLVAMLLYTLRGTPFVYQGDELGLADAHIPAQRAQDVDGRDPARSPLPWAPPSKAGTGAGFSEAEPWLPVGADSERSNVATQDADPESMLSLVRRLAWYRRSCEVIQRGSQRSLGSSSQLLAYERRINRERRVIMLNFDARTNRPAGLSDVGTVEVATDRAREGERARLDELELAGHEGIVIRVT